MRASSRFSDFGHRSDLVMVESLPGTHLSAIWRDDCSCNGILEHTKVVQRSNVQLPTMGVWEHGRMCGLEFASDEHGLSMGLTNWFSMLHQSLFVGISQPDSVQNIPAGWAQTRMYSIIYDIVWHSLYTEIVCACIDPPAKDYSLSLYKHHQAFISQKYPLQRC